jgi:hypothetical protein
MVKQLIEKGNYYPPLVGDIWETVSPASLGWDETRLTATISYVAEKNSTDRKSVV